MEKQVVIFMVLLVAVIGIASTAVLYGSANASHKDFGQCNKLFNKIHKGENGTLKALERKLACASLKPGNGTD